MWHYFCDSARHPFVILPNTPCWQLGHVTNETKLPSRSTSVLFFVCKVVWHDRCHNYRNERLHNVAGITKTMTVICCPCANYTEIDVNSFENQKVELQKQIDNNKTKDKGYIRTNQRDESTTKLASKTPKRTWNQSILNPSHTRRNPSFQGAKCRSSVWVLFSKSIVNQPNVSTKSSRFFSNSIVTEYHESQSGFSIVWPRWDPPYPRRSPFLPLHLRD